MNSRTRWLVLGLAVLLAFGIGWLRHTAPPPGNMTGSSLGGAFALIDQNGKPVTDADFKGRYRLMYFGYTFCPDVCPTDVAVLSRGLPAYEKTRPGRGGKGAADLHHRRSRSRRSGSAEGLCRGLSPAPHRPHRPAGGDRGGAEDIRHLQPSRSRPPIPTIISSIILRYIICSAPMARRSPSCRTAARPPK